MDPTIIASIISTAADVGIAIFEKWTSPESDAKKIKKKTAFMKKHYNELRGMLSKNCMRVLKKMEDGQSRRVEELIVQVYSDFKGFGNEEKQRLKGEFEYRLNYMEQMGVIVKPKREYFITELGILFINVAREKKDYPEILFA